MDHETITIDYICPLTRETCIENKSTKENPFTGTPMLEKCAWATRDGGCAVAKLMQAVYSFTNRGGY